MKKKSTHPPELLRKKVTETQDKTQKVGRLGSGWKKKKIVRDNVSQINVHNKRPAPQGTRKKRTASILRRSPRKLPPPKKL